MNNFPRYQNFRQFLFYFQKLDCKNDTRHSFLESVTKSEQNFIKDSQKNTKFDAENKKSEIHYSFAKKMLTISD